MDKWDLQPGHDLYSFMESMVHSDEIDKVLIICDKGYYEKAEARQGGVGTETQIISPEVYSDVKQEKFIPIVSERDENSKPYIPTYIKSRMYIDLSSDEKFESEYERLLRHLYKRPEYRKPALGQAPSWLFDDAPVHFKTANINKQIRDAITRKPSRVTSLAKEFIYCYFDNLDQFQIENMENPFDQQIMDKITDMLPLRDDYVEFLELLCSVEKEMDISPIIGFFEDVYRFTQPPKNVSSYRETQYDHYKFLIHELYIYTVAVMIENNQFDALGELLKSEFFIKDRFNRTEHSNYQIFYARHSVLDEIRKNRLESRLFSIAADTMTKRANLRKYPLEQIVNADLILHYISVLDKHSWAWFPILYVYGEEMGKIELFQRIKSKRHFEKVKGLFMVNTPEELKSLIMSFEQPDNYRYQGSFRAVPSLAHHIKPEEICTLL
ncbi:TIR domain-containing protein [Bacillus sp. DNRA2]|nr:TIR domain-containing protein [Bacillus sp. DNRA2]